MNANALQEREIVTIDQKFRNFELALCAQPQDVRGLREPVETQIVDSDSRVWKWYGPIEPDGLLRQTQAQTWRGNLATFAIRSAESMITFQELELGNGKIEVQVGDGKLTCGVCGCQKFHERNSLLNTSAATFFEVAWANKEARNYICIKCGYIFWFMTRR